VIGAAEPDILPGVSIATEPPDPAARTAGVVRAHVEGSVVEDEVLAAARERAADLGAVPVSPAVGATLTFLARVLAARTVVEVGTGAGVSGVYLLRGMRADGVLTTIDTEPEHQLSARRAFAAAAVAPGRYRLINGRALQVLPRLTDSGYDLVFVDAGVSEHPRYLAEAARLLRPGGVVALHGALTGGRVADPAQRDAETVALRETSRQAYEDDGWSPVLLPVGDGLLAACQVAAG